MVLINTLNAMLCPSFVLVEHNSLYHNVNRRTSNPTQLINVATEQPF